MRQETSATRSPSLLVREMGVRWCGSSGIAIPGKSFLSKHGLNFAYDPASAGSRIRSRET